MAERYCTRLRAYAVGKKLDKKQCTHHSAEHMEYYVFGPESYAELFDITFRAFDMGFPFYLSEHAAPSKRRFFVDVDCNKDGGATTEVNRETAHLFVARLSGFLAGKESRFSYEIDCQMIDDAREEPDGFFRWVGRARVAVDPLTSIVLQSKVDARLSTYHVIWPFVVVNRKQAVELLKEFLETCAKNPLLVAVARHVDVACVERGSLRAYLNDNFKDGAAAKRPFVYDAILHANGDEWNSEEMAQRGLDVGSLGEDLGDRTNREKLFHLKIWRATSLLYGRHTREQLVELGKRCAAASTSLSAATAPPRPELVDSPPATPCHRDARNEDELANAARRKRPRDEPPRPDYSRSPHDYFREPARPAMSLPYGRMIDSDEASVIEFFQKWFSRIRENANQGDLAALLETRFASEWEPQESPKLKDIKADLENLACIYMNNFVAFIKLVSKTLIVVKEAHRDGSLTFTYKTLKSAEEMFINGFVTSVEHRRFKKAIDVKAFDAWKKSSYRLWFHNCTLGNPYTLPVELLNVWQGFKIDKARALACRGHSTSGKRTSIRNDAGQVVEEKVYNLDVFLNHIFSFLCAGNDEIYAYVMRWLAHTVQRPFEKKCAGLVFVSQEGVGKDIVATAMNLIIGEKHYLNTCNVDDIAGKFTSELEGKILVVLDEASKLDVRENGRLKSLISESTMRIERKGQDAFKTENHVNLMIFTNIVSTSLFDVGPDARRWMISLCDSSISNATDYFADLVDWLGFADGRKDDDYRGVRAFADYLYNLDLSKFSSRVIPESRYLVQQKLQTMPKEHFWWYESLLNAIVMPNVDVDFRAGERNVNLYLNEGQLPLSKEEFRGKFLAWCRKMNYEGSSEPSFWARMFTVIDRKSLNETRDADNRARTITLPSILLLKQQFKQLYKGMSFDDDGQTDYGGVVGTTSRENYAQANWKDAPMLDSVAAPISSTPSPPPPPPPPLLLPVPRAAVPDPSPQTAMAVDDDADEDGAPYFDFADYRPPSRPSYSDDGT